MGMSSKQVLQKLPINFQVGGARDEDGEESTYKKLPTLLPDGVSTLKSGYAGIEDLVLQLEAYASTWTQLQNLWNLQIDEATKYIKNVTIWVKALDQFKYVFVILLEA